MQKRRILFVDDETNVLQGTRRAMHSKRDEWDMHFAHGGAEALERLRQDHFDAIVTDMRMPVMHGSALLRDVALEFPGMIRLILSGESERHLTYATVTTSHQFLPKPCNAEVLRGRLDRAFAYADLVEDAGLRTLVTGIGRLPSDAGRARDYRGALASASPDLDEIARIAASDPGLSAKLLQIANSAYFGIGAPVASVRKAVGMLGVELLNRLVEESSCAAAPCDEAPAGRIGAETARAAAMSCAAGSIARALGATGETVEIAETAALLRPLARLLPGYCEQSGDRATSPVLDAASAYICALWGLPPALCETLRRCGSHGAVAPETQSDIPVVAVLIAGMLALSGGATAPGASLRQALGEEAFARLDLDRKLPQLMETTAAALAAERR